MRKMIALTALENAPRRSGVSESRFVPNARIRSRTKAIVRPVAARRIGNGIERGTLKNGRPLLVPALVVTDTVNVAALPFETCSVDGP